MTEILMRTYDEDGEFETVMLSALKPDGTTEVFYQFTRRKPRNLEAWTESL